MLYLNNAFALSMLENSCQISAEIVTRETAENLAKSSEIFNALGHKDIDNLVQNELNLTLPAGQRTSIKLTEEDDLFVAQYSGPRLPEGATSLPEDAEIVYWFVEIV